MNESERIEELEDQILDLEATISELREKLDREQEYSEKLINALEMAKAQAYNIIECADQI